MTPMNLGHLDKMLIKVRHILDNPGYDSTSLDTIIKEMISFLFPFMNLDMLSVWHIQLTRGMTHNMTNMTNMTHIIIKFNNVFNISTS